MRKITTFLHLKNVSLSPKHYFIDALNAMAVGLFGSLVIGLVLKNIGLWFSIPLLKSIGEIAQQSTGAAIAIVIAYTLKAPLLILVASVAVGLASNEWGGVLACYIATILAVEIGKCFHKMTTLDIIVTPAITLIVGLTTAFWIGSPIRMFITNIGEFIEYCTHLQPIIMSIATAVVMGMLLTLPISSAAIAITLSLSGEAAGAATIGCCAQMIGFAVMSVKDNDWKRAISIGIGTSMLQMSNIIKNPKIWIPPILTSAIIAPFANIFFSVKNVPSGAGMGTCGLVGQIGTIEAMGANTNTIIMILLLHFIAPATICWLLYNTLLRINWIKKGDLQLSF